MTPLISQNESIGLELADGNIRAATIKWLHQKPANIQVFSLNDKEDVKQLYIHHPILVTGLEGYEVLVRPLTVDLTKQKDIDEALAFQAEPLLPYPVDQALLNSQQISQTDESTLLTLIAARQEAMKTHLEKWEAFQVEPEQVASIPSALATFGEWIVADDRPFIILHVEKDSIVGVLIKNKKLIASFAEQEGLKSALNSSSSEKLQKQVSKISYVLFNELHGEPLAGILLTGSIHQYPLIYQELKENMRWPLIDISPAFNLNVDELQSYAVPIGLAIGAQSPKKDHIDFRLNEWAYPHPWSRLKQPLLLYTGAICLLTFLFYLFGEKYVQNQEHKLKQSYVDLLANRGKTHEQFEIAFLDKHSDAKEKFNGEVVPVDQLSQQDLIERLNFFQSEIQSVPDTFPLFANTPRVSDVLAWLSQHPVIAYEDENGQKQARLKIENFSYVMVKRPVQNKKQEKYQIKIELELSSSTPKWAREFHDALIAPNDWIDPKSEVKWSSNRGKYKTSFYLKDKTMYQSL